MRVLLTGATGFIGRYVLPVLLKEGHQVVAVTSRVAINDDTESVQWLTVDLLDENACRQIVAESRTDILIHLAWYAEHGKFWTSLTNFDWVRAASALLDAFAKQGGQRVVFAGTCAEYDWQYGYCTEGVTPTEPQTIYGKCKDATRRVTQGYAESVGLQWVWGRIFFPFGFGEPENRLLPSVINALLKGEPVRCSHGQQFRDFMPVEEVARAFVHLACKTTEEGEFNISTGTPTRIADVVEFCVDQLGLDVRPEFGTIKTAPDDPPLLVGDARLLRRTGWQPELNWRDAVARLINKHQELNKN